MITLAGKLTRVSPQSAEPSIHEAISAAIVRVLRAAKENGSLSQEVVIPDSVVLDRPKNRDHGDFATSVALALAKPAGMQPRTVAELLKSGLEKYCWTWIY